MKRIGLTHRVDDIEAYGERRDSIDQGWYKLILSMGMLPIPLPNVPEEFLVHVVEPLNLSGIILTGGNSIAGLDSTAKDAAPERDEFENALIRYSLDSDIPLIGVCRGMQMISQYFGGHLIRVEGHINSRHELICLNSEYELPKSVNSFHGWAVPKTGLGSDLQPIATDSMGNIEAFIHGSRKILGIMWHPERVNGLNVQDVNLLKRAIL